MKKIVIRDLNSRDVGIVDECSWSRVQEAQSGKLAALLVYQFNALDIDKIFYEDLRDIYTRQIATFPNFSSRPTNWVENEPLSFIVTWLLKLTPDRRT